MQFRLPHEMFTRKTETEHAGSQASKTISAVEVLNMHSGTPETVQKPRFFDL